MGVVGVVGGWYTGVSDWTPNHFSVAETAGRHIIQVIEQSETFWESYPKIKNFDWHIGQRRSKPHGQIAISIDVVPMTGGGGRGVLCVCGC